MGRRAGIFLAAIVAGILTGEPATAQIDSVDVTRFHVRQAYVGDRFISTYLDVRNAADEPTAGILREDLEVSVGDTLVPIDTVLAFDGSDEGIAYIFLVDVSKSLRAAQFEQIKQAMNTWLASMSSHDRAAVMTFGNDVDLLSDFTADTTTLRSTVDGLSLTDDRTALHEGLLRALGDLGRRADPGLPSRRIVITLSDGMDDADSRTTKEEVIRVMQTESNRIPVYAIGFVNPPVTRPKETGLTALAELARASGGLMVEAGSRPLGEVYDLVRQRIDEVHVARIPRIAAPTDGNVYRLQVALRDGDRRLTDGVNIRLTRPADLAADPKLDDEVRESSLPVYLLGGSGVLLLLLGGVAVYWTRRRARRNVGDGSVADESTVASPPVSDGLPAKSAADQNDDAAAVASAAERHERPGLEIELTPIHSEGEEDAYRFHLTDQITIGRNRDRCDLAFPQDTELSGSHAALHYDDGHVMLYDLDSLNGTSVNGIPVKGRHRLDDGDVILLGGTELRLLIAREAS